MPKKIDTDLPPGVFKRGDKHYIQYTDAAGKRHRESAGSRTAATNMLLERKVEALKRRMPGGKARLGLRVNELIDDAIEYAFKNNNEVSAQDLRLKFERIRQEFGNCYADKLKKQDIASWLDSEAKARDWKPSSRNRYHSAFSLMFRLAMEADKMDFNPASEVKRKQEPAGRIRFLSREEEDRLVEAITKLYPAYLPIFILSEHTGTRLSEQLRAEVGDYDEATGTLVVRQTKNKRGPAQRYVPMTPMAVEAYNKLSEGKSKGDALCTNMLGNAMDSTRYWFDECLDAAGIEEYSWHCNRHTAISRWVMAGVPIAAVASFAGHANISMTQRYAHLTPGVNDKAVAAMMSYYKPQEAA